MTLDEDETKHLLELLRRPARPHPKLVEAIRKAREMNTEELDLSTLTDSEMKDVLKAKQAIAAVHARAHARVDQTSDGFGESYHAKQLRLQRVIPITVGVAMNPASGNATSIARRALEILDALQAQIAEGK